MNNGFVFGAAFGSAFAGTLIMFAVSALAIQNQKKAKLGWQKTLLYFAIALATMTAINSFRFFANPSLLKSNETSLRSLFCDFGLPLIVSVGTLLWLWKPKNS